MSNLVGKGLKYILSFPGIVVVIMREQSVVRGEESFHLAAKAMRAKNLGQGQGQAPEAGQEVGQAVGRVLEVGQGRGQSLAVGRGHALSQGQEVGQQGQSQVQGHAQDQSLVVQQGHDQDRNPEVLLGQDLAGLVREVQQDHRNQELGQPQGHRQGRRSLVKDHLILEEGQGVKLKIEC